MCNRACLTFAEVYLREKEVKGKAVLEIGSYDVNGSLRSIVENMLPKSYIGVDILKGPGVDKVCDADSLLDHFGKECFDLVISTEMLEHVRDWRKVISNMKNLMRRNGVLLVTTRSYGVGYHGFPSDFWRYEVNDARILLSDLLIEQIEQDPIEPGVYIKARKPTKFVEHDLTYYKLYSILKSKRCDNINIFETRLLQHYWRFRSQVLKFTNRFFARPKR
ncbi:MAG: methyltransferase domain-containing protein [Syntrophorhabdales bacterium]|jgi:SAM-dependent methyltransferase